MYANFIIQNNKKIIFIVVKLGKTFLFYSYSNHFIIYFNEKRILIFISLIF